MKFIDYQERRMQGSFQFPIAYYRQSPLSPRYHMQLHWHTYYEILFITSGTFHLTLGNETRLLEEGECVLIPGGTLHGGNPNNCTYESIVFDFQLLMKDNPGNQKELHLLLTQKRNILPFLTDYDERFSPLVQQICQCLSEKRNGYELAVRGYFFLLVSLIIERELYTENELDNVTGDQLTSLKNVLAYISEHYGEHINLSILAKKAGMNPKYFCRYFKSLTDRTPIDYLNYYRIECACELLSTKDISIREVAISCGFNDESYFIKIFHKYKGTTPKQFLKTEFT